MLADFNGKDIKEIKIIDSLKKILNSILFSFKTLYALLKPIKKKRSFTDNDDEIDKRYYRDTGGEG